MMSEIMPIGLRCIFYNADMLTVMNCD